MGDFMLVCKECEWSAGDDGTEKPTVNQNAIEHFCETGHPITAVGPEKRSS